MQNDEIVIIETTEVSVDDDVALELRRQEAEKIMAVNAVWRGAMNIVLGVATIGLTLPLFLLSNIGYKPPLSGCLVADPEAFKWAIASWTFLGIAIASGIVYFILSARRVRRVWEENPDIYHNKSTLLLRISLAASYHITSWGTVIGIVAGIILD